MRTRASLVVVTLSLLPSMTLATTAGAAVPAAPEPAAQPEQTVSQTATPATERRATLSLQGGWWSAEAEWRTRIGVYGALGVPFPLLAVAVLNHATWVVPLGARVGYDLPLSPQWSLRANAHVVSVVDNETGKCGCSSVDPTWRTFAFAEVGARYQFPSGVVAGADLPLFGMSVPHQAFPPPISLAFSQVYVGYSWGR